MIKKRKFIAVFTAVLLTALSILNFTISADNSSLVYVRYNAKTGAYRGSYTLSSMPTSDNTRSVILPDDERVIDWSKSGVVKLMNDNYYIGSGFVVGEHVIATAGHCVKDEKISEILLFNSNGAVSLHATPVESHLLKSFDNAAYVLEDGKEDYALITVKEDLSNYMCFNLAAPTDSFLNYTISVTGFPEVIYKNQEYQVYNTHNKHTMFTGNGVVKSMIDHRVYYTADTSTGNSGGPVYYTETYNGRTFYSVVAVHTHGGSSSNFGTRMTFDLLHFYNNNSNIRY